MTIEDMKKYMVEYKEPTALEAQKKHIYNYAEEIYKECESLFGKDFNLYDVIEKNHGRIHTLNLDELEGLSGSIFIHKNKDFDIVLPEYTSPVRDKFTLAHEFGHYLLHSNGWKENLWAARMGSGRLEWEANWFAAGFLMPKYKLENFLNDNNSDEGSVAMKFGVSKEAASIRLKGHTLNGL